MVRRINQKYVDQYDKVVLTQPLAHKKYIKQIYEKFPAGWRLTYESNSVHHICPYDGVFRNCADCGANDENFDVKFCTNKLMLISTAALIERIKDCMKARLNVEFLMNEWDKWET